MNTKLFRSKIILLLSTLIIISSTLSCSSSDDPDDDNPGNPNNGQGEVSGIVNDEDGNLYHNVRISLKEGTSTISSAVTNENGLYTFSNVASGTYSAVIQLPLSTSAVGSESKQVSVQNQSQAMADFTIKPRSVSSTLVLGDDDFLGEVRTEDGSVPTSASDSLYAVNVFSNMVQVPIIGPDGSHVTRGEWDNAEGTLEIFCSAQTTIMEFDFSGLLPEGVYTLWVGPTNGTEILGTGALGDRSGSENILDVDSQGNAQISVTMDPGSLSVFGTISSCLLTNLTDMMLILDYHIDGQTHGASPGPDGTEVGHLYFIL